MSGSDRVDSFEQTFDHLLERALAGARRVLGRSAAAEDVAAETMARAFASWRSVADMPYRDAWVVRVATNLAIDVARRRPAFALRSSVVASDDVSADRLTLIAAVGKLPRRQREVIALSYLSDVAEADVARLLGISTGSVKTHLHRGLAALRTSLGADPEEVRLV